MIFGWILRLYQITGHLSKKIVIKRLSYVYRPCPTWFRLHILCSVEFWQLVSWMYVFMYVCLMLGLTAYRCLLKFLLIWNWQLFISFSMDEITGLPLTYKTFFQDLWMPLDTRYKFHDLRSINATINNHLFFHAMHQLY